MARRRACRCCWALLTLLVLPASPSVAADLFMIVSQPAKGQSSGSFVDLGPYLLRAFDAVGKYHAVVYDPSLPAIRAAVDDGKLRNADLVTPLTVESARKVAAAIGAAGVLTVNGRRTGEGVAAYSQMDVRVGQSGWSTAFSLTQPAIRARNRKTALLEGIYGQVALITEKVTGTQLAIQTDRSAAAAGPDAPKDGADGAKPAADGAKPASDGAKPAAPTTPNTKPAPGAKPADPNAAPARLDVLVDRFRRQGDTANVIVSLRRAVTERPRDAGLRRQLVAAYQLRGWAMAARDEAKRAVDISPDDPVLHRLLGDGLLASGDNDAAIREYNEAVRLGPKDADSHVALGDALWNATRADDAQKSYEAGAQADPKNPLPFRRLAVMLARQNRYGDCLKAIKQGHDLTSPDAMEGYTADYLVVLDLGRASIADALTALQNGRKGFASGATSAEQAFKTVTDAKKRLQEASDLLADLPAAPGYTGAQALFSQAAALGVQAGEMTLVFLEGQDEARDKDATLLRLEASRQMNEGVERLKTLAPKKP